MIQDIPWKLLEKHFANKASMRDIELVNSWKASKAENAIIFDQLQDYFAKTGTLPVDFKPNTSRAMKKISRKINGTFNRVEWFPLLWKAASVILFIIGSWWLMHQYSVKQKQKFFATVNTSDTLRTMVTLPDSSRIWVNTGSTLTYFKKVGAVREVFLNGEAYFEIFRDSIHPFIIHAGKTITCVLGTKFNIRSYDFEKQVVLTVTHGKVSFGATEKASKLLTIGQEGVFDTQTGYVTKTENSNPNFLAWKTLEFNFDDTPLETVFKDLAEVYHFEYRFENGALKTRKLTATFIKRPLDEIVQTIVVSTDLSVSMQNKIYIVK